MQAFWRKMGEISLLKMVIVVELWKIMGGKYRKNKNVEMPLRRRSRPQQRVARRMAVAGMWCVLAVVVAVLPLASWVRLLQAGDQVNWVPALLGTAFMLLVSLLCMRTAFRRLQSPR